MINQIYEEEFQTKVLESDKTVLVDFFATWCGPCKMLSPVMEEIAAENPDIDVFKVNVDENPQLAATYGVSSIPNVLVFKNGKNIDNSLGYKPKNELQKLVENAR